MPSQFFGLTIAGSGLRASNAALNTTANNISNAQTEGYSRQAVDQQASNALRTFTTYGCAGAGVDTIAINRIRESFYDTKYWNNNSSLGSQSVKQYYARTIEDYFQDDGKSGFTTVFNKMNNALQSLTTDASSTPSKSQFIASVRSITDYFNNMYGNLQQLQLDVNLEIKQNVDQINAYSEQLATLNEQINVIEMTGAKANELRDKRELIIDKLSEIVDVDITETPIVDANDPTRETGGTRYIVKIAGGQPLVDANDYNELSYVARAADDKLNRSDADGLYKIMWSNGNQFNLSNASMSGKLRGLVDIRDGNNNSNFRGKVDSADPANGTITVKVDKSYLQNMAECTLPQDGGEITLGNRIYKFDSWTFDGSDTYTIKMDALTPIDASVAGKEVEVGSAINYEGIPYYMEQMDAWIRSFAKAVNDLFYEGTNIKNQSGDSNPGNLLFTAYNTLGEDYTAADLNMGGGTPADNNVHGYYLLNAGNLKVSDALLNNADLLGTRSSEKVGVEECGQIEEMIQLITTKEKYSFRNASAGEMLTMLLSDVALNASNANTNTKTYEGMKTAIENQRTSVSGVDEDEEAVSLVKYQNSYTLASKMIQTLTEIYDQLILSTGV